MIVDDSALGPVHCEGSGLHCAREDVDLSSTTGEAGAVYMARGMVPGRPTNVAPFRGSCICERNGRVYCGARHSTGRTIVLVATTKRSMYFGSWCTCAAQTILWSSPI